MKKNDIIRAWRDRDFLLSLSEEERASLPANPSGQLDLSDEELIGIAGGREAAGTHYSHCDPTASWCDDCKDATISVSFQR
jgi:mersacidin/lichenicidin family type 2 lantibiotic